MALISKAFSDIITFSRSSNATRVGPDGTVQYAPHNLLTYSEQFDNAAWTKSAASITANAIAAPNGTVTADKFVEDSSTGTHISYLSPGTLGAATYTYSLYVKAAGRTQLRIAQTITTSYAIDFDLNALTATNSVGGATGTITAVGNGWYRCSMTFTTVASIGQLFVLYSMSGGSASYTGDGSSGLYVWGAQVSQGAIAGDYTPTTSAAVYGPRFDYDPVTLAAKGLLIEEQRTNLVTYSEALDNAAWTKADATITANAVAAPDGTTTADKMVESATTATHVAYSFLSLLLAGTYTYSIYVKPAGRTQLRLAQTITTSYAVIFDLTTMTATTDGGGATGTVTSVGNGWYRCTMTFTTVASITPTFAVYTVSGGNAYYAGDGSSGLYLWGGQAEAGAFATSYIPTVASSVTRSADVVKVTTLSPWFNATEGSLFAEITNMIPTSVGSVDNSVVMFDDTSSSNWIGFYRSYVGPRYRYAVVTAGSAVVDNEVLYPYSTGTSKAAAAYKANDFASTANGASVTTDTSGTVPTVTQLQIGGGAYAAGKFSGWIRRIAYYPRRLTNAELQALTA